jgi:uncharacterized protein with NRDE domain
MCLVALLYRVVAGAPVVLAANREEDYARGGGAPRRLDGVSAVGGVDPAHGGTWLGVNARGLLVAVTNRPKTAPPERPRSRGLLARELLACASAKEASERGAAELERGAYAGCNLLCADAGGAAVLHAGDWLRVRPLPPGVHVLSNRDVNDPHDPRVVRAAAALADRALRDPTAAVEALLRLCASHEPPEAPMCFRGPRRGTVSSSAFVLRPSLHDSAYLHAQGPPDVTPYADLSSLLHALAREGAAP